MEGILIAQLSHQVAGIDRRLRHVERALTLSMKHLMRLRDGNGGRAESDAALEAVAAALKEIDEALKEGRDHVAVRQIREWLACTWDEALTESGTWKRRPEKEKLDWLMFHHLLRRFEAAESG